MNDLRNDIATQTEIMRHVAARYNVDISAVEAYAMTAWLNEVAPTLADAVEAAQGLLLGREQRWPVEDIDIMVDRFYAERRLMSQPDYQGKHRSTEA